MSSCLDIFRGVAFFSKFFILLSAFCPTLEPVTLPSLDVKMAILTHTLVQLHINKSANKSALYPVNHVGMCQSYVELDVSTNSALYICSTTKPAHAHTNLESIHVTV